MEKCIDPRTVKKHDHEGIAALFLSHDWQITSDESHPSGILVRYRCRDCSATGLAVFKIGEGLENYVEK